LFSGDQLYYTAQYQFTCQLNDTNCVIDNGNTYLPINKYINTTYFAQWNPVMQSSSNDYSSALIGTFAIPCIGIALCILSIIALIIYYRRQVTQHATLTKLKQKEQSENSESYQCY
jgi:ABC-type phosphate/phosphonate transport system permease subunit